MSSRKSSRLTRTTIFEEDDDDDEDVDDPSFEESEDIDDIELEEEEEEEEDRPLNTTTTTNPTNPTKQNCRLFLEAFSPIAEQAIDFLVAIAEPVSRPKLIHEYMLTEYSLYAAVSVGINADNIIQVLNKLCKTDLPEKLIEFIRLHTKSMEKRNRPPRPNSTRKLRPNPRRSPQPRYPRNHRPNPRNLINLITPTTSPNLLLRNIPRQVRTVRKACSDKGFPMLEEYDFRADTTLPTLDISLRPLHSYTLVGVTAGCTVKKRVLVLCTSAVSVEQWAREFKSWTNVKEGEVAKFTSQHKELLSNDNGILISTYTMVTFSSNAQWGLLILDEVHVVPAEMFKKVLTIVAAHCKLGLTATLVREDDKIRTLNYLIGPKLYEANWLDLAKKGHIARVRCSEVWCDMTKEFYKEYLGQSSRKRQLLYVMNPSKIQVCQYLIEMHERLGDKVIVFSDNVFALKHYATKLNRPYIYGGSSTADRLRTLQHKHDIPLKVGDTSIDIPEASCLIQISSHYGSRRQEAQRLGRILRAKKNAREEDGYNSFFYTLVSRDTEEVYYCAKRQQFLIDQGYSYDIITNMKDALEGGGTATPLVYQTINERLELLPRFLYDFSEVVGTYDERPSLGNGVRVTQLGASMRSLSGADNMAYIEQRRGGRAGRSGRE
ncbi:DNA repair helicase rad25 [Rhizoclosmatium globosum]|uniref:DNA 3'-5' helicase n=1 Tax=Rhizoclosmatium globosum TaxID=329046 RepID=A0A1Y2CS10_9FUNG|nr:DNA repair helicase rad25 [Rhizoclosmatium globosum]|eukprot:ORY49792.1 DNA repair helicase rad25 [Rhizoclosmatium globosum]